MDQTAAHLVPSDSHTYEVKGAKDVEVIGADDKRQILRTSQAIYAQLLAHGRTSIELLCGEGQLDRQSACRVARRLACGVRSEALV